jgi:hypothetical protein
MEIRTDDDRDRQRFRKEGWSRPVFKLPLDSRLAFTVGELLDPFFCVLSLA